MSTETHSDTGHQPAWNLWTGGAVAGLAGVLAMTAAMLAMGATNVLGGAIPGLYGLAPPPNLPVGIAVHIVHGVLLGVVFAGVVRAVDIEGTWAVLLAGVAYGVVVWALLAALLMPQWLAAVGFPQAPPFPNFAPPSLLWHVVYGGVAGAVLPVVGNR